MPSPPCLVTHNPELSNTHYEVNSIHDTQFSNHLTISGSVTLKPLGTGSSHRNVTQYVPARGGGLINPVFRTAFGYAKKFWLCSQQQTNRAPLFSCCASRWSRLTAPAWIAMGEATPSDPPSPKRRIRLTAVPFSKSGHAAIPDYRVYCLNRWFPTFWIYLKKIVRIR